MITSSDLIVEVMRLSITTSALVIPSISLAYFIMSRNKNEITRMSSIIGMGSTAAIILLIDSISCFTILAFGWDTAQYVIQFIGGLFLIGCGLLVYVILTFAGVTIKREIIITAEDSLINQHENSQHGQRRLLIKDK
jgi:hypothetical protein